MGVSGWLHAEAGSCLDYDASKLGAFGEFAVLMLPVLFIITLVVLFMWWQIRSINVDEEALAPVYQPQPRARFDQRITCLGLDLIPPNAALPCRCIVIPCIEKPKELLGTYMWNNFIFSWPYNPREDEPPMPLTSRKTIALISIMFQLLLLNVLGMYMGQFVKENISVADVTGAAHIDSSNTSVGSSVIIGAGGPISFGDALLNILIVTVIDAILVKVLTSIYGFMYAHHESHKMEIAICFGVALNILVVAALMAMSLLSLSCEGFVMNVLMPFFAKTPLGVAISPIFYILENTIGKGHHISFPLDEDIYPVDEHGVRIPLLKEGVRDMDAAERGDGSPQATDQGDIYVVNEMHDLEDDD